jgi:hypothetical protein
MQNRSRHSRPGIGNESEILIAYEAGLPLGVDRGKVDLVGTVLEII